TSEARPAARPASARNFDTNEKTTTQQYLVLQPACLAADGPCDPCLPAAPAPGRACATVRFEMVGTPRRLDGWLANWRFGRWQPPHRDRATNRQRAAPSR